MAIGERIQIYRKALGLKGKQFAAIIGISGGSLSDLENDKTKPKADTLESIVLKTDVNSMWLLTGIGEMRRDIEPVPAVSEKHDPYIASVLEMMRAMDDDTKRDIQLSVQKEKLLRELLKEKWDMKAA